MSGTSWVAKLSLRAFEAGRASRTDDGRFFIDPLTGLIEGGDRFGV